jgi:hypothetical protein
VGSTHINCNMDWNRYALAWHNPDGTLDTSVGIDGNQTNNWRCGGPTLRAIGF